MSTTAKRVPKTTTTSGLRTPVVQFSSVSERDSAMGSRIGTSSSTAVAQTNVSDGTSGKTHDNVASLLRRKALITTQAASRNLDGPLRARASSVSKQPQPTLTKLIAPNTIRKSISVQTINRTGSAASSKGVGSRAQSVQNICRIPTAVNAVRGGKRGPVQRTVSTQNMINPTGQPSRIPINVMACNAELLSNFEKEKKTLERRISELIQTSETRKTETEKLKIELKNVNARLPSENVFEELELLRSENAMLKGKLSENGISVEPFTDTEKLFLLQQMNNENRDRAREATDFSGATGDGSFTNFPAASEGTGTQNLDRELRHSVGDLSGLTTQFSSSPLDFGLNRWSSASVDRGLNSVAYLHDRILQMQETHYSTNEELQATLQELTDLQDSVNELTSENERLADEKSIVLESLCAQTEKLENARLQVEHLKTLLIRESELGHDRSENECQLVALIKSSQEEREELLLRQTEFQNATQAFQMENRELTDIISALRDKVRLEEMKNEEVVADKRELESCVLELKKQVSQDQQSSSGGRSRAASVEFRNDDETDGVSLEKLLQDAKVDKQQVEAKLQKELSKKSSDAAGLERQIAGLNDLLKECKTNAKFQTSKLESRLEQFEDEKEKISAKNESLKQQLDRLQQKYDQCLEEKKVQTTKMLAIETELQSTRKQSSETEGKLQEISGMVRREREDWSQFKQDLLMVVGVANTIRTEAEQNMETVLFENQQLRERFEAVSAELATVKQERDRMRQRDMESPSVTSSDIRGKVISTVDRELAVLRQGRLSGDAKTSVSSLPVKHLIESIEEEVKGDRSHASLSPSSPPIIGGSSLLNSTIGGDVDADSLSSGVAGSTESNTLEQSPEAKDGKRLSRIGLRNFDGLESVTDDVKQVGNLELESGLGASSVGSATAGTETSGDGGKKPLVGILTSRNQRQKGTSGSGVESTEKATSSVSDKLSAHASAAYNAKTDPLTSLAKQLGGSKRNALLRWCQNKTATYTSIDITNFSSSWNDGMAFCALLHCFVPDKIPYKELSSQDKMKNFRLAFQAAESSGLSSAGMNLNDLIATERPDWQAVFTYVTDIYKHFEVDNKL